MKDTMPTLKNYRICVSSTNSEGKAVDIKLTPNKLGKFTVNQLQAISNKIIEGGEDTKVGILNRIIARNKAYLEYQENEHGICFEEMSARIRATYLFAEQFIYIGDLIKSIDKHIRKVAAIPVSEVRQLHNGLGHIETPYVHMDLTCIRNALSFE